MKNSVKERHMPAASKIPDLLCYEDLIAPEDDRYEWPSTANG